MSRLGDRGVTRDFILEYKVCAEETTCARNEGVVLVLVSTVVINGIGAFEIRFDVDGDGIPNYLDTDSDGDGKSDAAEFNRSRLDSDCDGVHDYQDSNDRDGPCFDMCKFLFPDSKWMQEWCDKNLSF